MILLDQLVKRIKHKVYQPQPNLYIQKVTSDSRRVEAGTLFVAVIGTSVDGHQFIDKAIEQGAVAVLVEKLPQNLHQGVTYLLTDDTAEALGQASAAFFGYPSEQMEVVGVTGTNGKTTIATLLYRLHRLAGYSCGLLSTVCNYIDDEAIPSTHTTPAAEELQALLARMQAAGCQYVFMEVSSHSVTQRRIAGIHFRGGIFSNLTRDHLDYHGTVQNYLNAKKRFFDDLGEDAFALTNMDERNGQIMLQNTRAQRVGYALHTHTDYVARVIEQHLGSTELTINGRDIIVQLVGLFNAYNILAVYSATRLLGMPEEEALLHLSQLQSVDGRFQVIESPVRGYFAIVDYAHTPDALTNVLETIRGLRKGESQIITVVGCGGDRDRGKRPIMAKEAVKLSDKVILTSDNPRTEDPNAIIQEMQTGLSSDDMLHTLSIVDRTQAIRTAIQLARTGDIILIAGKGHETYQEIQGVKYPFDDREIVRQQIELELNNQTKS